MSYQTWKGIPESPYLTVERWANTIRLDLLAVPPLSYEASVFIHGRKLALYR